MKKNVKSTVSFFRLLIAHSQREYEPLPEHVVYSLPPRERIYSLGWEAKVSLREGIALTYPWIEAQVKTTRKTE